MARRRALGIGITIVAAGAIGACSRQPQIRPVMLARDASGTEVYEQAFRITASLKPARAPRSTSLIGDLVRDEPVRKAIRSECGSSAVLEDLDAAVAIGGFAFPARAFNSSAGELVAATGYSPITRTTYFLAVLPGKRDCAILRKAGRGVNDGLDVTFVGDPNAEAATLGLYALSAMVAVENVSLDDVSPQVRERAIGFLRVYQAMAARTPGQIADEGASDPGGSAGPPPPPPPAVTTGYGVYEYETPGLKIGLEIRDQGVALAVKNGTDEPFSLEPGAVEIETPEGVFHPSTFHALSLMGYGAPMSGIRVSPGESAGFVLSGLCAQQSGCHPEVVSGTTVPASIRAVRVGGRGLEFKRES